MKVQNQQESINIDFGSTTFAQMAAKELQPKTFKEKRNMIPDKPGNLDHELMLQNEKEMRKANRDMLLHLNSKAGGSGEQAFKSSSNTVNER